MKRTIFSIACTLLFVSQTVLAQGIIVNKTDGTKVKFRASDVESITTYDYVDDTPDVPTEVFIVNGVKFKMVEVKGGSFNMGATNLEDREALADESANGHLHQVTLSDFWMGQTEVTQDLWETVMTADYNLSRFKDTKLPVQNVEYAYCLLFINKLNALLSSELGNRAFRLPTEAEWEYAAKGGQSGHGYKYSGSNDIDEVACYNRPLTEGPMVVAQLKANELGIYDMSGNVYEWCSDLYGAYTTVSQVNPQGPPSSTMGRVRRGGCWCDKAFFSRVTDREYHQDFLTDRDIHVSNQGLRLVLANK